jgi:hypothetical protein
MGTFPLQGRSSFNQLSGPGEQMEQGATAEDILRQVNPNNPGYGMDPARNQQATIAMIQSRMANDPAYNLRGIRANRLPFNKQLELHQLIQEIATEDNNRATERGTYQQEFNSPAFEAGTRSYTQALQALRGMLSGEKKLSLMDAYFIMESAHGESYLTQPEYKNVIQQSANFIRQWMIQHKLDVHDNTAINYAVQQFLGKPLSITSPHKRTDGKTFVETSTHLPFRYDYKDFTGEKDHRNFFLTKCLATGTGQCNSMPALYLVLTEALGGMAYLAIAPQHSLVKYPDAKGNLRNFEPTSNWDITNEWYLDNMFISRQALKNKLYLSPWNNKQTIADLILQLSYGYFRKFGGADGKFINDCIETAEAYFPQHNNLSVYFTRANLYSYELVQAMRKNGINSISNISQSPETQRIFEKWQANEQVINDLGYQEQPRDMYIEMMKYHEFRGRSQEENKVDGSKKRDLFIK